MGAPSAGQNENRATRPFGRARVLSKSLKKLGGDAKDKIGGWFFFSPIAGERLFPHLMIGPR